MHTCVHNSYQCVVKVSCVECWGGGDPVDYATVLCVHSHPCYSARPLPFQSSTLALLK